MNLPIFSQDKANHVIYGAIIAAIMSSLVSLVIPIIPIFNLISYSQQHIVSAIVGLLSAAAGGLIKEMMDKKANDIAIKLEQPVLHSVEKADFLYTVQGGMIISIPIILISLPHIFK